MRTKNMFKLNRLTIKRHAQRGQGLVEYAIIIALVGLVASIAVGLIGLAASRSYGIVAGALGAKRDVHTDKNWVYFDDTKPWCGNVGGQNAVYAQFFSDIDKQFLSVTTDVAGVNPEILDNEPQVGIGNYLLTSVLPADTPCPTSLVIQSDTAHGGVTVVWAISH